MQNNLTKTKSWFEERHAPTPGTYLCLEAELVEGQVKEFSFGENSPFSFRMFVYKKGDEITAFRNACPHYNIPLNHVPGDVFTTDGKAFLCMTHFAKFDTGSGLCIEGPCKGESLDLIPLHHKDKQLFIGQYS